MTLNVLNVDGSNRMLQFFYESYEKYSDKVEVNYALAKDYAPYLESIGVSYENVSSYSLIITGGYRDRYVDASALYNYYYDGNYYEPADFYEYIQQVYYYYQQYYPANLAAVLEDINKNAYECFRGELIVSSQIEYVSREIIEHSYLITDNGGDAAWNGDFADYLELLGTEDLSLAEKGEIPADANNLVICSPDEDLTEEQTAKILDFLKEGGGLTVFTTEKNNSHTNLMSILDYYGMSPKSGLAGKDVTVEATDEDPERTEKTTEITLNLNIDNDIFGDIDTGSYTFKVKDANANKFSSNKRSSLLVYPVFTTQSDVYLGDDKQTVGTHTVAAAAEEVVPGGTTRVVWFTGGDSYLSAGGGNSVSAIPGFSLKWMTDTFKSSVASVSPKIIDKTNIDVSTWMW